MSEELKEPDPELELEPDSEEPPTNKKQTEPPLNDPNFEWQMRNTYTTFILPEFTPRKEDISRPSKSRKRKRYAVDSYAESTYEQEQICNKGQVPAEEQPNGEKKDGDQDPPPEDQPSGDKEEQEGLPPTDEGESSKKDEGESTKKDAGESLKKDEADLYLPAREHTNVETKALTSQNWHEYADTTHLGWRGRVDHSFMFTEGAKARQEAIDQMTNFIHDPNRLLEVTVSTIIMAALDKPISNEHLIFSSLYLRNIKNEHGDHPPNISNFIHYLNYLRRQQNDEKRADVLENDPCNERPPGYYEQLDKTNLQHYTTDTQRGTTVAKYVYHKRIPKKIPFCDDASQEKPLSKEEERKCSLMEREMYRRRCLNKTGYDKGYDGFNEPTKDAAAENEPASDPPPEEQTIDDKKEEEDQGENKSPPPEEPKQTAAVDTVCPDDTVNRGVDDYQFNRNIPNYQPQNDPSYRSNRNYFPTEEGTCRKRDQVNDRPASSKKAKSNTNNEDPEEDDPSKKKDPEEGEEETDGREKAGLDIQPNSRPKSRKSTSKKLSRQSSQRRGATDDESDNKGGDDVAPPSPPPPPPKPRWFR